MLQQQQQQLTKLHEAAKPCAAFVHNPWALLGLCSTTCVQTIITSYLKGIQAQAWPLNACLQPATLYVYIIHIESLSKSLHAYTVIWHNTYILVTLSDVLVVVVRSYILQTPLSMPLFVLVAS